MAHRIDQERGKGFMDEPSQPGVVERVFYWPKTKAVRMDLVFGVIFFWLFTNVVLGVILLLGCWRGKRSNAPRPSQVSSNIANQSSVASPSTGR